MKNFLKNIGVVSFLFITIQCSPMWTKPWPKKLDSTISNEIPNPQEILYNGDSSYLLVLNKSTLPLVFLVVKMDEESVIYNKKLVNGGEVVWDDLYRLKITDFGGRPNESPKSYMYDVKEKVIVNNPSRKIRE